jgi:hypothetical protein
MIVIEDEGNWSFELFEIVAENARYCVSSWQDCGLESLDCTGTATRPAAAKRCDNVAHELRQVAVSRVQ